MSKKKDSGLPDRSKEKDFANLKLPAKKIDTAKDMERLRQLFKDSGKKQNG